MLTIFQGKLISISTPKKDENGYYINCTLNEKTLGEFTALVRQREWPLQHLNLFLKSRQKLDFIPLVDGYAFLLPINNQRNEILGILMSKLVKKGERDFLNGNKNSALINRYSFRKSNKEIEKNRVIFEKLYNASDDSNEGNQKEDKNKK